jgi:hypothetical protein
MTDQQLEENIAVVIEAICKHRNSALGPFINRATLTLIPSQHFITIDVDKYTLKPTAEETESVCFFSFIFKIYFNFLARKTQRKEEKGKSCCGAECWERK